MKKLTYFASLAAMLLFAACSSDTEDFVAEGQSGQMLTIEASMPESVDGTRINTDDLGALKWEEGDVIKAYGYANGWAKKGVSDFVLKSIDTKTGTAVFKGNAVEGATAYRFLYNNTTYNYIKDQSLPNDFYLGQTQDGYTSSSFKSNLVMANNFDVTPNADGKFPMVTLAPLSAVVKMNVKNMPKALQNSKKTSVTLNWGPYVNAKTTITNAKMKYGEDNFIYIATDVNYTINPDQEIKVTFEAGAETFVAKATTTKSFNITSGKIYTLVIDYASNVTTGRALLWDGIEDEGKAEQLPEITGGLMIKTADGTLPVVPASMKASETAVAGFFTVTAADGSALTEIAEKAFFGNTQITDVIIPAEIKTIGASAFENCTSLATVEFNEGLENIGAYAFRGCHNLLNLYIPGTVKTLGTYCFAGADQYYKGIKRNSITMGRGMQLTTVGDYVFNLSTTDHLNMKATYQDATGKFNLMKQLFNCQELDKTIENAALHIDSSWEGKPELSFMDDKWGGITTWCDIVLVGKYDNVFTE